MPATREEPGYRENIQRARFRDATMLNGELAHDRRREARDEGCVQAAATLIAARDSGKGR